MSNKNKFLICIIFLIILFIAALTLYTFSDERNKENIEKNASNLIYVEAINEKKDLLYDNTLDKDTYKDNIITEIKKSIDYTFFNNKKSIIGKIYIDDNGYLFITDELNYDKRKISDIKFKTLYWDGINIYSSIYILLISQTNDLYYLKVDSNNIKTVKVYEVPTKYKVLNFVDINFDNDMLPSKSTLFVLEADGNIYEVNSGIRYKKNIKVLFDSIIVFDDNTVANAYGKMLEDKNGNYYKIKYAFNVKGDKEYHNYDFIMIVTEDNKAISILREDNYRYSYEDLFKIKNIAFDKKNPFVTGKLKISFDNNSEFIFDAMCSTYYCINEFDY